MKSSPPWAIWAAIFASPCGGKPCGFSAEQVSARLSAPTIWRRPSMPWLRPAESLQHAIGKFRIRQRDVGMHGGIAEQHVQHLPRFQAGGGDAEADARFERAMADVADVIHPAHDIVQHALVGDGGDRHLHALLDRDAACACLHPVGGVADVIDGGQALRSHGSKMVAPVVFFEVSSSCALAASFSA